MILLENLADYILIVQRRSVISILLIKAFFFSKFASPSLKILLIKFNQWSDLTWISKFRTFNPTSANFWNLIMYFILEISEFHANLCFHLIMVSGIRMTETRNTSFDNANVLTIKIFPYSDGLRIFERLRVTFKPSNLVFKFLSTALLSFSLWNQKPKLKKLPSGPFYNQSA